MKKIPYKIVAILMSFVVLFSTTSFAVTTHFCGEALVDFSIFDKASSCGMENTETISKSFSDCSVKKKDCCTDEQIMIDGQSEVQLQIDKISFKQQVFIASLLYSYINLFEGSHKNVNFYSPYKPPLVIRQLYKIDETYLI